jgi:hypothetical protein
MLGCREAASAMSVGHIDFLHFIAGEEQNLLTSLINLRSDFDVFAHLDGLFRGPVGLIDVPKGEEVAPSLYLFVHYQLYISISALARAHLSECLASTRKAIDASFSAYEMMIDPATIPLYENRDNRFQFIRSHIATARKANEATYPLASELLALHDICSEFGSHADVSSFVHRVELKDAGYPGKNTLLFHYFQFPRDKDEYHAYFVETLLAYYQMLVIFKPMVLNRALGLPKTWKSELEMVGDALEKERAAMYGYFEKKRGEKAAT